MRVKAVCCSTSCAQAGCSGGRPMAKVSSTKPQSTLPTENSNDDEQLWSEGNFPCSDQVNLHLLKFPKFFLFPALFYDANKHQTSRWLSTNFPLVLDSQTTSVKSRSSEKLVNSSRTSSDLVLKPQVFFPLCLAVLCAAMHQLQLVLVKYPAPLQRRLNQ